jgi:hypothetical protein
MLTVATTALAPPAAQASAEHPRFLWNGEERLPNRPAVATISWGLMQVKTLELGTLECVNLAFGTDFNNTEPGRAGQGTESIRAYGEVLGFGAASYLSASAAEPNPHCKSSTGFLAWFTAEPPPQVSTEVATRINGAPTERLVVQGPLGETASHREPSTMPWLQEAEGTENAETKVKRFWVKTGIAASATERAEVEAEEAAAGVPTERRTGCYRFPEFTESVREPGFTAGRETELALRPAPRGCIKATLVASEVGVEVPLEGTLEPEEINGARSGLSSSTGDFEGESERNERALRSIGGAVRPKSLGFNMRQVGYLREELLTLK